MRLQTGERHFEYQDFLLNLVWNRSPVLNRDTSNREKALRASDYSVNFPLKEPEQETLEHVSKLYSGMGDVSGKQEMYKVAVFDSGFLQLFFSLQGLFAICVMADYLTTRSGTRVPKMARQNRPR